MTLYGISLQYLSLLNVFFLFYVDFFPCDVGVTLRKAKVAKLPSTCATRRARPPCSSGRSSRLKSPWSTGGTARRRRFGRSESEDMGTLSRSEPSQSSKNGPKTHRKQTKMHENGHENGFSPLASSSLEAVAMAREPASARRLIRSAWHPTCGDQALRLG